MTIHVHLMDRGLPLDPTSRSRLLDPIHDGIRVVEARAPGLQVDLSIVPTDIYDDLSYFSGGKAYGPGYAQIEVNPQHPNYADDWPLEGAGLTVHELHHCLRWRHVGPRGWTLGEIVVLEGLAILAESLAGTDPLPPGPDPLAMSSLRDRLWSERNRTESDQTAWFRSTRAGDETTEVPVNYLIGRSLMRDALTRLDLDPFEAATMPAETLLMAARAAD